MTLRPADRIEDPGGRQYHLGVVRGEVAPRILLVGDPARADRTAARFDRVLATRRNREFVTHTGEWKGLAVSVTATGIGAGSTEIAVCELLACERNPVFIRAGSCGALQAGVDPGDLAITTGALRLERATAGFVEDEFPAVAHHEVVLALATAASRIGSRFHLGLTATSAGFYGGQGRKDGILRSRDPDLPERLRARGVLNMEMEASVLLVLSQLAQVRAGAVCAVFANRPANVFIDSEGKTAAEDRAVDAALEAFRILDGMDRSRRGAHFTLELP